MRRLHGRSFSVGPMRRGALRDEKRKVMNLAYASPILLHSNNRIDEFYTAGFKIPPIPGRKL